MRIGMIWAQSANGALAQGMDLPWDIPEDRSFFRESVRGRPLVMGRRTWLATGARVIKGSPTFVLTTNPDFDAGKARVVTSFPQALSEAAALGTDLLWVAGGARIYAEAEPLADILVRTAVDMKVDDADVFAPPLSGTWLLRAAAPSSESWQFSKTGTRYRYELLTRPGVQLPSGVPFDPPETAFRTN
ncbi:dihydrofolate reductase [Actinobaculum suis]|uniref:dihydrofolate reductase n=1 Tax=Actinobaculum suis TaxID=1657 RepID=A0A1G7DFJ2_9ACTO|nr:dihydrofolate reductase [Actinobaculum suis]MDY5154091.1 dihydrofolate reductase [Actinobaculum suis]SDE50378.1 dihydrofolate reductase [Actinobaculum suis]